MYHHRVAFTAVCQCRLKLRTQRVFTARLILEYLVEREPVELARDVLISCGHAFVSDPLSGHSFSTNCHVEV